MSSDPSDIEATIAEPAELESVQKPSPCSLPVVFQPQLCDHSPAFPMRSRTELLLPVMPDSKILSLVLRPVSSQPLTCLSPVVSALQMPGKFSFLVFGPVPA